MSNEPPNYAMRVFLIMLACMVFVGVVMYKTGIDTGHADRCPAATR